MTSLFCMIIFSCAVLLFCVCFPIEVFEILSFCACLFMCNRFASAYEFLSLVYPPSPFYSSYDRISIQRTIHLRARARARAIDCNFHKKNTRNLSFNLICVGIVSFLVKNNRVKPRERTLNDLSLENVATITFVDLMFMRLRFNDRCSFVAVVVVVVFCSDGHDLKLFLYQLSVPLMLHHCCVFLYVFLLCFVGCFCYFGLSVCSSVECAEFEMNYAVWRCIEMKTWPHRRRQSDVKVIKIKFSTQQFALGPQI